MTELIDTHLGPYQLVEIIGRGGMSIVYKAYQPILERFVAVKVLLHASDPLFAARFRREALAIAQFQHPNILPIYDFGDQNGRLYLVMQCVENGATLSELLRQTLAPIAALRLIVHVLGALDYAHARGVIHRDIKPGNILMPSPTWPMLADFGIAKLLTESLRLTLAGTIIGTAAYMAPEQASGEEIDARADLYAMGIVLYELLTGRVPFEADTPIAVLLKHAQTPPPPPREINSDIPPEVETALLRALEKDPNKRYQSATEMADALGQIAADLDRNTTRERRITRDQPNARVLGGAIASPTSQPAPPVPAPPPVQPPHPPAARDDLYQAGLREFRAGHWDQAIEHLNRLIALDPAYADAPKLLAQVRAAQSYAQQEQQRRAASAATQPQKQPDATPAAAPACPRCGRATQPEWTVCPLCGAALTVSATPGRKPRSTLAPPRFTKAASRERGWLIWTIPLVALAILGGGLGIFFGLFGGARPPTITDSSANKMTLAPSTPAPTAVPTDLPTLIPATDVLFTEAPAAEVAPAPPTSVPTIAPPTSTLAPPITPSPLPDAVVGVTSMNLRAGASTVFPSLGQYGQGTALEVLGRTADSTWLKVQTPDERVGWMRAQNLQVNRPVAEVAVVQPPPLPTPRPTRPRPTAAPPPPPVPAETQPLAPTPEPPTPTSNSNGGNGNQRPPKPTDKPQPTKPQLPKPTKPRLP